MKSCHLQQCGWREMSEKDEYYMISLIHFVIYKREQMNKQSKTNRLIYKASYCTILVAFSI